MQHKYLISCLSLLLFSSLLHAQNRVGARDVRSLGMGKTTIGMHSFMFPASVASMENTVYIGYQSRFSMKELSIMSASAVFNNSFLNFGLNFGTYGFEHFRESKIGLTIARKLSDKINLGVAVQLQTINSIAQENNTYFIYPDIGIEYQLTDKLTIGLGINNLLRAAINDELKEKNVFSVQTGFSYRLSKECVLGAEIEPNSEKEVRWRTGIEYTMIDNFSVRAGYSSKPALPSIGVGYKIKQFSMDVAAEQYRQLGTSVSLGLKYDW